MFIKDDNLTKGHSSWHYRFWNMLREFSDRWFQLNNHSWAPNYTRRWPCVSVLKQTCLLESDPLKCWLRTLHPRAAVLGLWVAALCWWFSQTLEDTQHSSTFTAPSPPYSHNHLSFWLILRERKYEIQVEKRNTIDSGSVFLGTRIARSSGQHPPLPSLLSFLLRSHMLFTSALFNYHLCKNGSGFLF